MGNTLPWRLHYIEDYITLLLHRLVDYIIQETALQKSLNHILDYTILLTTIPWELHHTGNYITLGITIP